MKIKDVVGECLVKMGRTDFSNNQTLDTEQTELKDKLIAAINIAYRHIVSEYLPLIEIETVKVTNGKIAASSLYKKILYPIKIVQNDEKISFYSGADCIFCDAAGEVKLTYAYMPSNDLTFASEIDDMRLTRSALADGALSEYYFQNKMFDLAKSFDSDFRKQIGALRYRGKNILVKARRWQA